MLQIVLEEPGRFAATDGPEPTPAAGEALVRVHRVGVCGTDLHAFAGRQPFFTYPRILGHELGVEVIDPGTVPHGLRAGDRCAVEPYLNCGRCSACRRGKSNCCAELKLIGVHIDGGMRSLLAVPAEKLHRSATLTYDQLALIEMLGVGMHAVDRARMTRDDCVLLIGAGPIGLSVLQFALLTEATVAVMDVRDSRLAFCRDRFGVRHTLTPAEAPERLLEFFGGDLPTIVMDATGNARSMSGTFDLIAPGGRIVFVGLFQGGVTFDDPNFHRREITLSSSRNALPENFRAILALMEEGRLDASAWITNRLALADVPSSWSSSIAGNDAVLKAVIEV
jgi:2-desacetyl-2-hydroxyethyl bacteriochlorophyllide A dehydrogenase